MDRYENIIRESLEAMQRKPIESLRCRVMNSAMSGADTPNVYRGKLSFRAVVIAAVIAALVFTTAAAYRVQIVDIIKQLVLEDSIATQVVYEDMQQIGSFGVMNRTSLLEDEDYPLGFFNTLEEARQAAPFYIREPLFLPDSVSGLRSVGVWRVKDPDMPDLHFVILNYDIPLDGGGIGLLELRQTFAGADAYIELETTGSVEKIMIGDIEAVLITYESGHNAYGTVNTAAAYTIWWLKDEIAYELNNEFSGKIDLNTMVAIAESIP